MTTFGDQILQYGGVPVSSGGMLPVLGGEAKAFFVDPANGADGNSGLSPEKTDSLKTVAAAYAKCTDKQGDVVYLLNDGNTSGSARETAALVWAKDNTHLVGLCAPSINQRSRITPPTTSAVDVDAFTPFLTVSGNGCIFSNIALVQGQSEDSKASVGILCSGLRNYFSNVSVLTGQHANQGDEAATTWVTVTGEENVFEDCYIGTDTIARSAANTSVRFGSGATDQAARNIFRRCVFAMFADATSPFFISAPTENDVQRWNLFDNCSFINSGSSSLVAGVNWVATSGNVLLKDCAFSGVDNVTAADDANVLMYGISSALGVVDVGLYKGTDVA